MGCLLTACPMTHVRMVLLSQHISASTISFAASAPFLGLRPTRHLHGIIDKKNPTRICGISQYFLASMHAAGALVFTTCERVNGLSTHTPLSALWKHSCSKGPRPRNAVAARKRCCEWVSPPHPSSHTTFPSASLNQVDEDKETLTKS